MDIGSLIAFLIIGLIVGAIARFLVPGPDPMGWIATIVLGIVGSFVGGFLVSLLAGQPALTPAGWIGSVIGAIIVLLIWRQVGTRRTVA